MRMTFTWILLIVLNWSCKNESGNSVNNKEDSENSWVSDTLNDKGSQKMSIDSMTTSNVGNSYKEDELPKNDFINEDDQSNKSHQKKSEPKSPKESKNKVVEQVDFSKINLSGTKIEIDKIIIESVEDRLPKPDPISHTDVVTKVELDKHNDKTSKPNQKKIYSGHDGFNTLLKKYVSAEGRVDYSGIHKAVTSLDDYLVDIKNTEVASLNRNEKLAFWINAYNAFTIKLIVSNYPVARITDLEGGKPWDKQWIDIGGKLLSLNDIENKIIRPQFREPRIHFAVNCAAKSCPTLLNQAFTADNLEYNLETQTKRFINNATFNKISNNAVEVSQIFEWYAEDFGDLIAFLNKYSTVKIDSKAKVNFLSYNWDLNK